MFALALLVRLYHITAMPDDYHPARQYRCASIARSFYLSGQPGAEHASAQNKHFQDGLLEPPIMEMAAVVGYKLLGGEKLWFPRVLSILFWLAGGYWLFRLAVELSGRTAALFTLAFFLFVPYAILGSRSFQPEPLMVALIIATVYGSHRYFQQPSARRLLALASLAAFTILIKPTSVFAICSVFFCLSIYHSGWKLALTRPALYLFGLIAMLPSLAYYGWGLLHVAKLQDQMSISFVPQLFVHLSYWSGWLKMIGRTAGIIPFVLALAGLCFFSKDHRRMLVVALFLGYLAYGLVFNYHIHTHDYYSLQLLPIVALALGPILAVLSAIACDQWRVSPSRLIIPVVLVFALLAVGGFWFKYSNLKRVDAGIKDQLKSSMLLVGLSQKVFMFVNPGYYGFDQARADEEKIGVLVNHSQKTVLLTRDNSLPIIYNAGISGKVWPSHSEIQFQTDFTHRAMLTAAHRYEQFFQPLAPEYFIITEFEDYTNQPDLKAFLEANFPVHASENKRYLIFQLQPKTARN